MADGNLGLVINYKALLPPIIKICNITLQFLPKKDKMDKINMGFGSFKSLVFS